MESGKIFLIENERHTGEKVSILVQVMSISRTGNLGPGWRVRGEGPGGRSGERRLAEDQQTHCGGRIRSNFLISGSDAISRVFITRFVKLYIVCYAQRVFLFIKKMLNKKEH